MSVDLKIERFGVELVNRLFVDYEVEGFVPHSLADYSDVESELNEDVAKAVAVHIIFFRSYYARVVYREFYCKFKKNAMYFLNVIMDVFPHQLLGKDTEEVMSKFFSSCAFVMVMCLEGIAAGDSSFHDKIHLIWAMFVDLKLKDEFYLFGGWAELRRSAWVCCEPVYRFIKHFKVDDEGTIVDSNSVDLTVHSVLTIIHFKKQHVVESDLPMGLQWVDFVVKGPPLPARPKTEQLEDLEAALMSLKEMTDPFGTKEMVYEKLVPAMEAAGMEERACMDALASRDFGKYPKFEKIMEVEYGKCLREIQSRLESRTRKDTNASVGESELRNMDSNTELEGDENCIERTGDTPLSRPSALPYDDGSSNKSRILLKFPKKEDKEKLLQEFLAQKQPTETGTRPQIEAEFKHFIEHKLEEVLQGKYPLLMKSISRSESSENERESQVMFTSKVSSVLSNCLKAVVSDSMESKPGPKLDCSSGLPKTKRGKTRRNHGQSV